MSIPLIILAGCIGSGKSTIGPILAKTFKFAYIESDSLQSHTNIDKWLNGIFLEDVDRWDWYDRSVSEAFKVEEESSPKGIVLECAAPKKAHRDRLRRRVQYLKEKGSKLVSRCIFFHCSRRGRL